MSLLVFSSQSSKQSSNLPAERAKSGRFRRGFSTLVETIRKPLAVAGVALALTASAGAFTEAKALDGGGPSNSMQVSQNLITSEALLAFLIGSGLTFTLGVLGLFLGADQSVLSRTKTKQ